MIGTYSLYEIIFNLNFRRTFGGLIIAALAICVGLWSRPDLIQQVIEAKDGIPVVPR